MCCWQASRNMVGCRLTQHRIILETSQSILFDDILGYEVEEDSSVVSVVYYPLVKNKRLRKEARIEMENRREAMDLLHVIEDRCRLPRPPHCPDNDLRHALVVVNPFSGKKLAKKLWKKVAEPVLLDGGWLCDVIETTHPAHAVQIAQEMDLDKYHMILVDSGDGLVTEVLRGLILRRDRDRALKVPIGHLPGGTSNALASAICYACNEPFSPRDGFMREAALMAARPAYRPLSLFRAEVEDSEPMPMFMSLTFGLIADIDIESERFRCLGMIRLHLEAILRIAQLPTTSNFHVRISYIPVGDAELNRKTMLKHTVEREEFGPGHFDCVPVEEYDGHATPDGVFASMREALAPSTSFTPLLPPLDQPISSDEFTVVEGDYVFACANSLSHLGSDLAYLPSAKLDEDDIFYLTLIDWRLIKHRLEVGILMSTIDNSHHLDYPCFQVIPVRACRIEPLSGSTGNVAVDGEPLGKDKAFQVEALPFKATVIGRKEVERPS